MNSEHISKNLQDIIKKYNITNWERVDGSKYKIEIFNSVIVKDIYNLSKTLIKYENIKKEINLENEKLLDTYINNNDIWLKIQAEDKTIYDINLKGYSKMLSSRRIFEDTVTANNHILLSSYINAKSKVLIDFNCGHPPNRVTPNSYLRGSRCPYCSNKIVSPYINDCYTLRKDLLKYFIDEKDAIGMPASDRELRLYKCPKCGYTRYNTLANIDYFGFSCHECGDGISYPERMMKKILEYLNIPFYIHKQFDWCIYDLDNSKHYGIYDFYLYEKEIIIEMDGLFHSVDNHLNGKTKNYAVQIDSIKDKLAQENGCVVIRIDCYYKSTLNRFEYIKHNIIKSLHDILDINNIDWDKLEKDLESSSSFLIDTCNLWNNGYSISQIVSELKLDRSTIINYLKKGKELQLCNYNRETSLERKSMKLRQKFYKYTKAIRRYDLKIIGVFYNTDQFIANINDIYGIDLSKRRISQVLNTTHSTKNMYFQTITKDEYDKYKKQSGIITDILLNTNIEN